MDLDSDSDYVYDTYIREPDAGLFATKTTRSLPAVGMDGIETEAATEAEAENVGYLVIRPEDTEAWEEFMSDGEESGDDEHGWGSSDSNGMYTLFNLYRPYIPTFVPWSPIVLFVSLVYRQLCLRRAAFCCFVAFRSGMIACACGWLTCEFVL